MMKKLFAALTALACALPAVPAFTASALSWEEPTDYVVTDVFRNEENVLRSLTLQEIGTPHIYEISTCGVDMDAMLEGQETPEIGDIISLSVPECVAEVIPECLHYDGKIPEYVNYGNITEIGTLEYLTFVKQESWKYTFTDDNLTEYVYYDAEEYGGTPAPDLTESQTGLYYLYNGLVVLPADENEVDDWKIPWTVTGVVIGPQLIYVYNIGTCYFDDVVDSQGNEIGAGDVVKLKIRGGIAETSPAILPAIEYIDRLGNAGEMYGYKEYTVTENNGRWLTMTNEAGEETIYSYTMQSDRGFTLYNSELAVNAQSGDTITFMCHQKGSPAVPCDLEQVISRTEFAVIGVDDVENPQNYIIMESNSPTHVYWLRGHQLEAYFANGGTPLSYGDIFTLAGNYGCTEIWGTNDIFMDAAETIRIEGSVFDTEETAEFTFNTASSDTFVWLKGEAKGYEYPVDFMLGTGLTSQKQFTQPDGIDWAKPDVRDRITMYTYGGVPMFPKSLERLGDADGDNEVNASDAATLLITAAENGAGLAGAVTFSADVDADGTVSAQDAASVLIYAAAKGTGASVTWDTVLNTEEAA